jgi:transposase InsO family protein
MHYPVRLLCDSLEVPKSIYYEWLSVPMNKRQRQTQALDDMIKLIFYEHKCRYGSTRITIELKARGIPCTRHRVSERMKLLNLIAKARHRFKATTDSNHAKPFAKNVLEQDFNASHPNQKWLTDITYVPTQEGWLYLCVFIDLYSRSIIGWSMNERLKSNLVEDALKMALFRRSFPTGIIVHSDRGVQYCSNGYQQLLNVNGLICSMSATGCCYDNAAMESFFHTLKVELVHDENYETREKAKTSIVEYIECYYNRQRRHSAINYRTPAELETMKFVA